MANGLETGMDWMVFMAPAEICFGPNGFGAWIMNNVTSDPTHEDGLMIDPLNLEPNSSIATHYGGMIPMTQELWDAQFVWEPIFNGQVLYCTCTYDQPDKETAYTAYCFYPVV